MANPFYVQPASALPGFQALQQGVDSYAGQQMKKAETQKEIERRKRGSEVLKSGDPDAIQTFMMENPDIAEQVDKAYQFKSRVTEQDAIEKAWDIMLNKKPTSQAMIEHAQVVIDEGGDASDTMRLAEEAQQDPNAGKGEAALLLMRRDPETWKLWKEQQEPGFAGKEMKVGAQSILEDGTIIQSTQKGPVVYNKFGERVKGEEAAQAVAMARAAEISNARLKEGGRRSAALMAEEELKPRVEAGVVSAKEAANASSAAFDRVEKVYQNIDNLREAVRLVEEEGADTGAIADRMPSFRSAAVKLDNLQGRLGLDVIGSTTFGALSEAELKFALSTALPQRLDGPALVNWAKQKIEAQEKLADYLEGAAIFLGTPGNTKADWIKKQKEMGGAYGRGARQTPPPGAGVPGEQPTEPGGQSARPVTGMSIEELMRVIQGGQ